MFMDETEALARETINVDTLSMASAMQPQTENK